MDAGTDTVSVYSRPGNLVASNDGGWLLIKSFEVTGQGKGLVTSLPNFDYPVIVPAGFKQSFYIATNLTDVDFWYSSGTALGNAFASNDDLDILEGYAIGNGWKGYAFPRQWNGAVHYSVPGDAPSAPTVSEPTSSPASSAAPSFKVCQYVSLPSCLLRLLFRTGFVTFTSLLFVCFLLLYSPRHTRHYYQRVKLCLQHKVRRNDHRNNPRNSLPSLSQLCHQFQHQLTLKSLDQTH